MPLHAGVPVRAGPPKDLERSRRSISRRGVVEKDLSLTPGGNACYQLEMPYRNGTTHVIFEPLDVEMTQPVLCVEVLEHLAIEVA